MQLSRVFEGSKIPLKTPIGYPRDFLQGQIATELGIGATVLGRWRRELRQESAQAFVGQGRFPFELRVSDLN